MADGNLRQLRRELGELLFEHQQMLLVQGPNLEARFQARIGKFQNELEQLRLDHRRARRHLEMRRSLHTRGEPIDPAALERQLDLELWEYRRRLTDLKDRQEAAELRLRRLRSPETSAAMRSLYRLLVRALHPDLHPHQSPFQQQLWFEVQQAYQVSDAARLETILAVVEEEKDDDSPEEEARLRTRLRQLSENIRDLRQAFPFSVAGQLDDPQWVESQVNQLKLEIVLERQRLSKVQAVLQEFS